MRCLSPRVKNARTSLLRYAATHVDRKSRAVNFSSFRRGQSGTARRAKMISTVRARPWSAATKVAHEVESRGCSVKGEYRPDWVKFPRTARRDTGREIYARLPGSNRLLLLRPVYDKYRLARSNRPRMNPRDR